MTALFPYLPGLGWPVERSVGQWDTSKQISVSGKETRFANRTQARYAYSLTVDGLDSAGGFPTLGSQSKQALEALFNNTLGGALIFNFWDTDDNTVVAQPFGTGDGTTTQFQLYRTTAAVWNDAIFAPVLAGGSVTVQAGGSVTAPYGAPLVYKNGVLQTSGTAYSISSAGVVTFTSAPAAAAALTWTGSYWWPCNFDDDTLAMTKTMSSLWDCKKIAFTTRIY